MYVSTGPQISFMVGAKQITEGITVDTEKEAKISVDVKDRFNKTYFSIPLEVGYMLPPIAGKNLELKARYCIGLNEALADKSYGSSKYSMWQVMLSLPFIKDESSKN
jgi:hypothetical protein